MAKPSSGALQKWKINGGIETACYPKGINETLYLFMRADWVAFLMVAEALSCGSGLLLKLRDRTNFGIY
jgi:hypothetical protein